MTRISDPLTVGSVEIPNRLYATPIISNLAARDGAMPQRLLDSIRRRARGGWGLFGIEAVLIGPESMIGPRNLGLWADYQVPALAEAAEAIHAGGGRALIQLLHAGRQANVQFFAPDLPRDTIAPSATTPANPFPPYVEPREMTEEKIEAILKQYIAAARRAVTAGFDIIEIHGSHGFLPQQFLSPYTNHRKDRWGGSWEKRLEFVKVLGQRLKELSGDFTLAFRLAADEFHPGGYTLEDCCRYIAPGLVEAGFELLDVSCGLFESFTTFTAEMYQPRALGTELARAVKKAVSVPVAAVGRVNVGRLAVNLIEQNHCDLVGVGRGAMADPDFAWKTLTGDYDAIRRCVACNACLKNNFTLKAGRCAINFEYNREPLLAEERLLSTGNKRKVLVVGGGPAGMEASRILAIRGFKVVLVEKRNSLGGMIRLAASLPFFLTRELMNIVIWEERELARLGVETHLGREVTAKVIQEIGPDEVVLATGSEPILPDLPTSLQEKSLMLEEYLEGRIPPGRKVLVWGGAYGAEAAFCLAQEGRSRLQPGYADLRASSPLEILPLEDKNRVREVVLVEEGKRVGFPPFGYVGRYLVLNRMLERVGVKIHTRTRVKDIVAEGMLVEDGKNRDTLIAADAFILAPPRRPLRSLVDEVRRLDFQTHLIGDCTKPDSLEQAIHQANFLARRL
jgi:2,4-dienoyl-CoA reductase (NADPH2)